MVKKSSHLTNKNKFVLSVIEMRFNYLENEFCLALDFIIPSKLHSM